MLIDISDRKIAQALATQYCKAYKIYSGVKYDFICEYFESMIKQDKNELSDLSDLSDLIDFSVKNGDIKIDGVCFFRKYINDLVIVQNKNISDADADAVVYTNGMYSLVEPITLYILKCL